MHRTMDGWFHAHKFTTDDIRMYVLRLPNQSRNTCRINVWYVFYICIVDSDGRCSPAKNEWDLTNGPLSKLLDLLDTQV